jgi:hypothetical protein
VRRFLLAAGLVLGPASAAAEPLVLDGQVGPAYLSTSRSSAIGHSVKPVARVGLRVVLLPRLEVGGSIAGVLDSSEHYRVAGGLAHARLALWHRPGFSLGAGLGLGAGYDADILHDDLAGGGSIAPYGMLAADARWSIGGRWLVGVEAGWDNLSIARLGLLVGVRLDGSGRSGTR